MFGKWGRSLQGDWLAEFMISTLQQQEILQIAKGTVRFNEPMREHTTIKIGGPADIWFEPLDAEDLLAVAKWADDRKLPRIVIGNGSNTLVRDGGIRGIVVSLAKFDYVNASPAEAGVTRALVGAGCLLQRLLSWAAENSLTGLENLAGIPGTVGGAVIMNAGTKDGTMGDAVESIGLINKSKMSTMEKEGLVFEYRRLKLPRAVIVIEANILLKQGERSEIESKMAKIKQRRKEIQPLIWPSLGSVFKNPGSGSKAWQLVDDAGLRGVRVGGARISNEHANWIINEGSATAKDVEVLIKLIIEKVKDKSDVALETEIAMIGENLK
jgi:UDP-N-acetylmuramate dehydrogenase